MQRSAFRLYRKPASKIYYARKRRKGKEYNECLNTESESLARKRAAQWIERLIGEEWGEKPRRAFNEAAERFAEDHFPTLKPRGAERYASSLVHLIEHFSGMYLDEITLSKLADFEKKRRKDVTPATIRRDLACLSSMFSSCEIWEWTQFNPVKPFLKKRGNALAAAEPRTRFLTHDEEEAILRHANDAERFRICAAIDTGLRKLEQMWLEWPQVHLDIPALDDGVRARGQIAIKGPSTKSKRSRLVPLAPRTYDMLLAARKKSGLVFPREDGERFTASSPHVWEAFKKLARKAGVENVTWHDLRRTCGCRLLQDYRMPIERVSLWLGHSSVKVTERHYAFLKVEHLHESIEAGKSNVIDLARKRALLKASGEF